MSVNRERPHVFVLPEDDANRQIAIGFRLQIERDRERQMHVLGPAGGWASVLESFLSDEVAGMGRYPARFMVLLMDCDGREERLTEAKAAIPQHLAERVFILGVWPEPEALKADLGSYEDIGFAMAKDCREDTEATCGHDLLRHNASELDRLRQHVRAILFPPVP